MRLVRSLSSSFVGVLTMSVVAVATARSMVAPSRCHAQTIDHGAADGATYRRLTLSPELAKELDEIDARSGLATALYVSSVGLVVTGVVTGVFGGIALGLWGGASEATTLGGALTVGGVVLTVTGLALLSFGIDVDRDSGRRRRDWSERARSLSAWTIQPARGGLVVASAWRF